MVPGFAAWFRWFLGSPLLHVVFALISFVVSLVVMDFFFFFRGEKGCYGFFSEGEEEEEEETEAFWFSFMELKCSKLNF